MSFEDASKLLLGLVQGEGAATSANMAEVWKLVSSKPEDLFSALTVALTTETKEGASLEAAFLVATPLCGECPSEVSDKDNWAAVSTLAFSEILPQLLSALRYIAPAKSVKSRNRVKIAAQALVAALVGQVAAMPNAAPMYVPLCLAALEPEMQWETKVASCQTLATLCVKVADDMGRALPDIIPKVIDLLGDTKKQVKAAAKDLLQTCADNVVDNDDMKPFVPALMSAFVNQNETVEALHTLGSTTFVQIITCAPLAFVTPLLARGLAATEKIAVKRMTAVIISNMSKLVEEPAEAMPLIPKLAPLLKAGSENTSDEEARGVMNRSYEQLMLIEKNATVRSKAAKGLQTNLGWASKEGVYNLLTSKMNIKKGAAVKAQWPTGGAVDATNIMNMVSTVACSLLDNRMDDVPTWNTYLTPLLAGVSTQYKAKSEEATKIVLDESMKFWKVEEEEDEDDAEVLCNTTFTLAFGAKILLHNTNLKLKRGYKYGLVGNSDCGKTSLLRAIANEQIDGFPDFSTVRTTFLEADIAPELSNMTCVEYVCADERIQSMGVTEVQVREALNSVGFVAKKDGRYAAQDDEVNTLSGGWRMKVALARAMLHRADILLMDEPTNHLDVINVQWVLDYLKSLNNVTAIMVSTHKQLLTDVAQYILQIDNLKLKMHKGNLNVFVENVPSAKSYFEIAATKFKMKFPDPSFIEGIKSKGKALMKMKDVEFTYPVNDVPTLFNITVQTSLSSRVACVGRNGAGKSTMVKLLTGELEPSKGDCWQHPGCRCAYVAQHAFHHIENHQEKTANEYIRWRYQYGEDREAVVKKTMVVTDEEQELMNKEMKYEIVAQNGSVTVSKRSIKRLTNLRRKDKKSGQFEYETVWNLASIANTWERATFLVKHAKGFEKLIKVIDTKEAAKQGMYQRPLTKNNVEQHLTDVGLEAEFGTHNRISALSGGQKVKVVIGAAMWNQPHIVILDEPTNYLDRESLGALAYAIQEFEGGVVIISHNDDFCSKLCKETWVLELGHLDCKGDAEWMKKAEEAAQNNSMANIDEMVDGAGNKIKIEKKAKALSRKEKKVLEKELKRLTAAGEDTYDIELQLGLIEE